MRKSTAYTKGRRDAEKGKLVREGNKYWLNPEYWNGVLSCVTKATSVVTWVADQIQSEPDLEEGEDEEENEPVSTALAIRAIEMVGIYRFLNSRRTPPMFDDRDVWGGDRMQLDANCRGKRPVFPKYTRGLGRGKFAFRRRGREIAHGNP